ncbi:MAG TPA: type II secretion system protein [Acidimicrobiales bacterium]|nr:type II secretion system protein [Acidimicrobiales bacterium]
MTHLLRRRRGEEGFTLIELMVVVLIIAILIAIAIPTFLGARQRANNRAAQSDLRNALTAEKTVYTDGQAYLDSTSSTLTGDEPSLKFVDGTGTYDASTNEVAVTLGTSNTGVVCLYTKAKGGNVYGIMDVSNTDATYTQSGTFYYQGSAAPSCNLTSFPTTATSPASANGGAW